MTDKRIEKIYGKLKSIVLAEKEPNLQLIKSEQLIFYCWKNYPLQFSDVEIESTLEKNMIYSNLVLDKKNSHVVYVASTLFAVGGHSRCILNFIDNQPNHQHTVILTRQNKSIPTNLTTFFESKNVDVIIQDINDLPLSKSAKLLSQVDIINPQKVYLFQHPDDLVPLMAFGKNTSHEVVQYSHADHVYSLGMKYFNKQLEFRNTGALISHFGKNVQSPHIQVLPIQYQYETPNRIEAKKKLGFDSNQQILGTLTNFSKAQSYNGFPSLVDVFLNLSAKYPNCVFLIIGLNENEFKSIAGRTIQIPHNICCLGIIVNPEVYYEALDLFLEPFPVGSGLGIIEACKHGAIPVFAPQQASLCSTFDVFHVEIQKHLIKATTIETFYSTINNYLNAQPGEINALSEKIRNGIHHYHRGEKWAANLEKGLPFFDKSVIKNPVEFLKTEAMFFQGYQKKSSNELIEHLLSLKTLVSRKNLLSFFIGRNRLFSIYEMNKQNVKRLAIKILNV